jgi:FAD/FMN-containing dehydrogenase/Fe-S oxidoreductase
MNAPDRRVFLSPGMGRTSLAAQLRRELEGDVLFDQFSRARYATDASIYEIQPIGVVVPKNEADLLRALDVARDHRAVILPRGAGTSQCGQTVGQALVIDNSKWLNQVIEFDPQGLSITVQPGMVLDRLNDFLRPHGLWFPVDVSTAAQCTIGGMAGNNSCGSRSLEYGNMVHSVEAIDAILADGTSARFAQFGDAGDMVVHGARMSQLVPRLFEIAQENKTDIEQVWPKVLRRVGGYNLDIFNCQSERAYTQSGLPNLSHLLVGSEGTLAYFKRIKLKLSRLPQAKVLGVVNFPSFHDAMAMTAQIVKLGPVAVELVDRTMIDLAMNNPAFKPVISKSVIDVNGMPTQAILLVEFAGQNHAEQLQKLNRLTELMADLGLPNSVVPITDLGAQKELWEVRKAGLNIMMSMKGDGKPVSFIEDCAVPLEYLAQYTQALTEVFARHGTKGTWYAHASVGTLHVRPILDMRRDGAQKMRAIANEASLLVRQFKGAFSGEHGDGLVRTEWVGWQFGPKLTTAFEQIKDLFDPDNRMNPGKIVRGTKMDDRSLFRTKPNHLALPLKTAFDWSAWNQLVDPVTGTEQQLPGADAITNKHYSDPAQGFAKAVDMCNNNGHCRKFDAGTMCPSFRVTQDEAHLTRGRANVLRQALSGALGPDALTSDAMEQSMALCVGCKGCKRDCPTGVDMAKMKSEFLYHYKARHGLTIKDRLVAFLPRYAPIASRFAALLNIRNRHVILAKWMQAITGFSALRPLPAWRSDSFLRQQAHNKIGPADSKSKAINQVVLLADTFNNWFEPENLLAAKTVLQAAGYKVHLAVAAVNERPLCCGRTFIASGLIDQAKVEAARLLAAVMPFVKQGIPVVGLEPSCLLTLRDEFLAMSLGNDAVLLSAKAMLFEEFLIAERQAGRFTLSFKPVAGVSRVAIHGHCHQKAFDAVAPAKTLLAMIPNLDVIEITGSCCGLAGSFGYEARHYETSMKMGELSLLPAVRALENNTTLVADGTSCRHQIAHGSHRKAEHIAVFLSKALD